MRDYYQDLQTAVDATEEDIAKAYKKLALRWHPKLSKDTYETAFHHFCRISQAYEVLSDPVLRSFYDKFGEVRLRQGFFAEGDLKGGYRFKNNPEEIFQKFFTSHNDFAKIFDRQVSEENGTMFGHAFGGQHYQPRHPPPQLCVEVPCTLKELFNGCAKQVQYTCRKLNLDGRTTRMERMEKRLEIVAGAEDGQELVFKGEGNEECGPIKCVVLTSRSCVQGERNE